MTLDIINACFELVGAILIWGNVIQTYKDKEVKGVFIPTIAFFSSWGLWNIFYYYNLGQILSWYAGMLLAFGNLVWVLQIMYYKHKENK